METLRYMQIELPIDPQEPSPWTKVNDVPSAFFLSPPTLTATGLGRVSDVIRLYQGIYSDISFCRLTHTHTHTAYPFDDSDHKSKHFLVK